MKEKFLNIKVYSSALIMASTLASSISASAGVYIDQTQGIPSNIIKKQEAYQISGRLGESQKNEVKQEKLTSEPIDFHSEYMKNQKANQESVNNKKTQNTPQENQPKILLTGDQQKELIKSEKESSKDINNDVGKGKEFIKKDSDSKIKSLEIEKKKVDEKENINDIKINSSSVKTITVDKPIVKTSYSVIMSKGFLSNSMREELQKKGWVLEWNSGSDREIGVEYTLNCKNIINFATQISELYNIKIDVYSLNKTVNIRD